MPGFRFRALSRFVLSGLIGGFPIRNWNFGCRLGYRGVILLAVAVYHLGRFWLWLARRHPLGEWLTEWADVWRTETLAFVVMVALTLASLGFGDFGERLVKAQGPTARTPRRCAKAPRRDRSPRPPNPNPPFVVLVF